MGCRAQDFAAKTVAELKESCGKLSLQTSGKKSSLVARLVDQQRRMFSVKAAAL